MVYITIKTVECEASAGLSPVWGRHVVESFFRVCSETGYPNLPLHPFDAKTTPKFISGWYIMQGLINPSLRVSSFCNNHP
jgi:hypothetical protein